MNRIKRAVFELFRDEILNFVGHHKQEVTVYRVDENIKFTNLQCQIMLRRDQDYPFDISPEVAYEKALSKAKVNLFNDVMNFVQVDERSILEELPREGRIIKLSLYVGARQ
jgi:hypothetical protein